MKGRTVISGVAAAALMILTGCGGSSERTVDTSTLHLNGGDGYYGGEAYAKGSLVVSMPDGNLSITAGGRADASFKIPGHAMDFGVYGAVFSTDTTVLLRGTRDTGGLSTANITDRYYLIEGEHCLYEDVGRDGDDSNDVCVTGLKVERGATLTLAANNGGSGVDLVFENDVEIDGVLRSAVDISDTVYNGSVLLLASGTLRVGADGKIDARGKDWVSESNVSDASDGSNIELMAGYISRDANLSLIIEGTLDTSGGSGSESGGEGKDGGDLMLSSSGSIYITGTLSANGGEGGGGSRGGSGGWLHIEGVKQIGMNGFISLKGGDSLTDAGDGGGVEIFNGATDEIEILSSAFFDMRGGESKGEASDYYKFTGGSGGRIGVILNSDQYHIAFAGQVNMEGGASRLGYGGRGGSFSFEAQQAEEGRSLLELSTAIYGDGGESDKSWGGLGGRLEFYLEGGVHDLRFLGYKNIQFHGGDGIASGGDGGLAVFEYYDGQGGADWRNEATLYGHGGAAVKPEDNSSGLTGASGGDGGNIILSADAALNFTDRGDVYLYGGRSWGDGENSDGGDIRYCAEDVTLNLENVIVDLLAGTGGVHGDEQNGSIINSCP